MEILGRETDRSSGHPGELGLLVRAMEALEAKRPAADNASLGGNKG